MAGQARLVNTATCFHFWPVGFFQQSTRSGAAAAVSAGAVGSELIAKAAPDGYSLLQGQLAWISEYVVWYGLLAPAKTPKDIIDKLNTEVVKILKDPETVRQLASRGAEASPTTSEAFAKFLHEDRERWKNVVGTAGIKAN